MISSQLSGISGEAGSMPRLSDQLTLLIDEMDEIDQIAASFQTGSPATSKAPPLEEIKALRERYLDWSARCQALLNEAGQQAFLAPYINSGRGIHKYISDPSGITYRRGNKYSSDYRSYHYWNHRYPENFRGPFNEQRLLLMQVRANTKVREEAPRPSPPPAIDAVRLHSRVKAVSSQLFKDKHYRQAILQACLALNEAVQQRSGRLDLDGVSLMNHVFSPKAPILRFSGHPDEQQGLLWLFSGMTMAIRNPRAHQVGEAEDLDANEALEILALISALYRALDRAELVLRT